MKKTQLKDSTRNIRKRIVSYFSICLVIMLGCGAFLTSRFMEAGLSREAAGYLMDHNFKNFEMISSLGLTDANIEDIKKTEGVDDAEGVMVLTATVSKGHSKRTATVLSETKKISVPEIVEGKMPAADNELALAEDFSEKSGIKVGDKVKLQIKSSGMDYPFHTHSFVITGLVRHPDYVHRKLANVIIAPLSSFDEEVTDGYYTRAFIKSWDPSPAEFYSEKYLEDSKPLYDRLDKLAKEFEVKRANEFKAAAYAKIDKEWQDAQAKLNESQEKIDANRAKLNSSLASSRAKLNSAQAKLNKKVREYEKKLKAARAKLDKVEAYCKILDKKLPGIKQQYKERREDYENSIAQYKAEIAALEKVIEEIEKSGELTPEQREDLINRLNLLADILQEILNNIDDVQKYIDSDEFKDVIEKIKEASDGEIDLSGLADAIRNIDEEKLQQIIFDIYELRDKIADSQEFIDDAKRLIKTLNDSINTLEGFLESINKYEGYISLYEKNKDKYLAKYEKKWRDAKNKLERERRKYQALIDKNWNKYYSYKKKYEDKLAEAVALLAENREEAEQKLKEAREEVDKVDCKWLALDRKSNPGYLDLMSQLGTVHRTGTLFGIMFLVITAMVCLSTLTIIIEEQKKMIGTTKAFGFHRGEVLGKYLLFGASAAVTGDILAFATGTGLSAAVLKVYSRQNMYPFDNLHTIIMPGPVLLISAAMIATCALATVIACFDILRSPASMLMKGQTLADNRVANKKKKEASHRGSLYSRLIFRNMGDDKARVIISTFIVAACCLIMGLGITLKLSYRDTLNKQAYEINNFDLRVDFTSAVKDADRKAIEKVITDSGAEYIEAMYENRIYRGPDGIGALNLVCARPGEISDYIGFYLEGKPVDPPSDGILLTQKMSERYSLSPGEKIIIYDNDVAAHEVNIEGFYNCYFGRMSIITPEAYKKYFGEEAKLNSRYIHLNGADSKKLRKAILAVSPNVTFDTPVSFRPAVAAVSNMFNLVTFITTGIAILMSFMILTNLANIFLTRKKTELSVMRVNGFSIRQTKNYLAREALITTLVGLFVGVLAGSLSSSSLIRMIEPIDMQFDRSYQWIAWVAATGLEGVFALIIYTNTFRKVKKLNLRDIA